MLIEGEIELCFAGKTRYRGPGEEILIPAGSSHIVRNTGPIDKMATNRWYYGYRLGSRTV
jgi:mannose-6-phosphate isomerase-like protein (cupin superfamily)